MATGSAISHHPSLATLLDDEFLGCPDMRTAYQRTMMIPTSETADIFLIRSHVAYWAGRTPAWRAEIKASRGHSYRVECQGQRYVVRISDHYDHRAGVVGFAVQEGGAA